jgi:hypothetical protein
MENIIKNLSKEHLKVLEYYYGIDIELYRPQKDIMTDVYGQFAGNNYDLLKNFTGIVVSDDFFPSDGVYAGNFEQGFLYTSETDINVADILKLVSSDGKIRRYKIESLDTIGTQDTLFTRYVISNLAN